MRIYTIFLSMGGPTFGVQVTAVQFDQPLHCEQDRLVVFLEQLASQMDFE